MKYVLIFWAVIVVVFLIVLSMIPIGKEPLTESYFENHTQLPSNITPNETYFFSFTVHNLEYRDMDYRYNVTYTVGNISRQISEDKFSLKDNASITIPVSFMIPEHFNRTKVEVNLTNMTIHFWATENEAMI
jgi:uncharacterized protein YdeI (BOF family)